MKKFKLLTAFFLALALSVLSVQADGNKRINWFYKRTADSARPSILGGDMPKGLESSLYIGREGDKTVYLTFDAGYSNENVEKILYILKAQSIKAAFFILPGIIKNSPETVKRMAEDGHLVCNHTSSHCDCSKITDIEVFKRELLGVEDEYRRLTGKEMEKYFRPPEGAFSEKTLEFCKTLGYTPVFWSFAYADWDNNKQMSSDKAKEKVLSQIHDGMVLLLHPTSKTNADILEDVINELRARGYSFGTLDDLKSKIR